MTDLTRITAARADIAKRRAQANAGFDAEDHELEIAERVLRRLSVETPAVRPGRKRSAEGIPRQFSEALAVIDNLGGEPNRSAFRAGLDEQRPEPITDGSFAALLSKLRKEHIETEGDIVRRKRTNEGDADVS